MKRLLSFFAVLAGVVGVGYVTGHATGQTQSAKAKSANAIPGIGVVDVEYIFKNYQKFTRQQEGFQAELEKKQKELTEAAATIKEQEDKRKKYKPDSTDYRAIDDEITNLRADLAAQAQKADKDFAQRENTMVRNAYAEIKDGVQRAVDQYGLSLVLQLRSTDATNGGSRVEIAKELNREVLYFHEEMDITQPVLKYLNSRFEQEVGVTKPTSPVRRPVQPVKKSGN